MLGNPAEHIFKEVTELEFNEYKFYAAGIGLIKTVDLTAGAEFVLVEFMPAETTTVQRLGILAGL